MEMFCIGTTIHDETVEVVQGGAGWALTVDGHQVGTQGPFQATYARAENIVPAHRRHFEDEVYSDDDGWMGT